MKLNPLGSIHGSPALPGDKSISHRCLLMASLASGTSRFQNLSTAEDVLSTKRVLSFLGVEFVERENSLEVISTGNYLPPKEALDCGNAGTLMRLMMGILSGQNIHATLIGDKSLSRRPMKRVQAPLLKMGAKIQLKDDEFSPVEISPSKLVGATHELAVASAQVKSAIMFSALFAEGKTTLKGLIHSRDHTERLLQFFGAEIHQTEKEIFIQGPQALKPVEYKIPNDISAASFWIAATVLSENGETLLEDVGVNPSRMGFVNTLIEAGAKIEVNLTAEVPEPVANIKTRSSKLSGFKISKEQIPSMVDEIPLLVLLATQCEGDSVIEGVEELRYKETDRIAATVQAIESLGGHVEVTGNDFHIKGRQSLGGGVVDSLDDHRIAMMAAVARYCVSGSIEIKGFECVHISDPFFKSEMEKR